jgi:ABC-2 type transport system permease protein
VRAYWLILRTCISERLTYRGDFAFATLVRFLPIVTQVFLWTAVYAGDTNREMNGYKLHNMVAYALLVMVGRAFSSMPGLANGIASDVRDGTIKKYLTQPVDMLTYLFCARLAHKLVYYIVAIAPFALVFYLCRGFFDETPDLATVFGFALSLIIAFLIGFLMETLIGLVSFWFLEVSSMIFIFMMVNYFLSGHMVPLDWLPSLFSRWPAAQDFVRSGMMYLPFPYLAYFPASLMLGKNAGPEMWTYLAVGSAWVALLFAASRIAFARGLRRYSAFGG